RATGSGRASMPREMPGTPGSSATRMAAPRSTHRAAEAISTGWERMWSHVDGGCLRAVLLRSGMSGLPSGDDAHGSGLQCGESGLDGLEAGDGGRCCGEAVAKVADEWDQQQGEAVVHDTVGLAVGAAGDELVQAGGFALLGDDAGDAPERAARV